MHVCSIMFEYSQDLGLAYKVMCASYSTPVPSGPPSLAAWTLQMDKEQDNVYIVHSGTVLVHTSVY